MKRSTVADLGQALCLAGGAFGAVGLIGWITGVQSLTTIVPGQPAMMPNTAVGCLLIGVAGALRRREHTGGLRFTVSALASAIVLLIGVGTLAEYAFGIDVGIDRLLLASEAGPYPGRPSPPTALALGLLAAGLLLLDTRASALAGWLILGAAFIAFTAMLGQSFGTAELYRLAFAPVIGVAVPTAVSLFLLSLGILFERPSSGVIAVATSSGPGGVVLRRLATMSILTPAVLGLMTVRLLPAIGVADVPLIVALLAASITGVSLVLLNIVARQLDRSHEALESIRGQAESLLEQAADGIFVADLNGHYTDVNAAGARMLGYTREEIVGKTILDLIPPGEAVRLGQEKTELDKGGVVVSEWQLRRKDGTYLPVEVSAKILPDGRWQGMVRDITDRKRAEAGLRRLATVLRYSNDAITVQDLEGNILEWNRGAEGMYGYQEDEAKRMNVAVLLPDGRGTLDVFDPGESSASLEVRRRARNGQLLDVWLTATKLMDENGRPEAVATFERDISERRRLEERLRVAEATSSGIIAVSADAIICIDETQRITLFNRGAERIFGHSSSEMIGAPLDVLIPERYRADHRREVDEFAAGPEAARRMGERNVEIFGLRSSGEEFPADAAISKLEVDGRVILTVALRDISEAKRIEADQRFLAETGLMLGQTLEYEATLSDVARAAVRYLADRCIVDVIDENGDLRRLRVESRDPSKRWIDELFLEIPLDGRRARPVESAIASGRPILIERMSPDVFQKLAESESHVRALRAADPHSLMVVPLIAHNNLLGVITLMSTEPKRHYGNADLRLAEDLARRAALSIENARLYRAAERAIQARDDVLGIVAHDLRNPLSTIVMQSSLMRSPEVKQQPEEAVGVIERAADRMNRIIEDLLDVTRLEAGRLTIERASVPAAALVSDSIDAHQAQAVAANIDLRPDVGSDLPEVWVDRDRILQVFENLIGNALKFTEAGGMVTVGAKRDDAEIVFRVHDNGKGIAEEDIPHLFDPFWQARTGEPGAGLGLAIVKGIVEAHGGRVWVESRLGAGSTFHFAIPGRAPGHE